MVATALRPKTKQVVASRTPDPGPTHARKDGPSKRAAVAINGPTIRTAATMNRLMMTTPAVAAAHYREGGMGTRAVSVDRHPTTCPNPNASTAATTRKESMLPVGWRLSSSADPTTGRTGRWRWVSPRFLDPGLETVSESLFGARR